MKFSSEFNPRMVSVENREITGSALLPKKSVTICCGLAGSPSCVTHHRPNRSTSVSTTAIGQETNVLQKIEMITTSTESSQRMKRLLSRLKAKLWFDATTASELGRSPR